MSRRPTLLQPPQERKIAILVYGFPPGVGATGTAALLNVPKSLEHTLAALKQVGALARWRGSGLGRRGCPQLPPSPQSPARPPPATTCPLLASLPAPRLLQDGYDLGELGDDLEGLGEAIVTALKLQEDGRAIAEGAAGVLARGAGPAEPYGARAQAVDIEPQRLKEMLTFPETWGPTEWGALAGCGGGRAAAPPCLLAALQGGHCFHPPIHTRPPIHPPIHTHPPIHPPTRPQAPSPSSPTTTFSCAAWRRSGASWGATRAWPPARAAPLWSPASSWATFGSACRCALL